MNEYVEFVYQANCIDRTKDIDWVGYVNLSISRINRRMLAFLEGWPDREEKWWAVLAFDPSMLSDPGVWFCTTNNVYSNCKRGQGLKGIEALFDPVVYWGHYNSYYKRATTTPDSLPTDPQAEVLYPGKVPLEYLRAIYVKTGENVDEIHSYMAGLGLNMNIEIVARPEVFL